MKFLLLTLLFIFSIPNQNKAQSNLKLDSIQQIIQTTYEHRNSESKMTIIKTSTYDTNQIMILQDRYNYVKVDTGYIPSTHYHFEYNPKYQNGLYFTERLPHSSKPKREYSKQTTKFKNYDDFNKRLWVKVYKKNTSNLLKQTQNKYDSNGNLTEVVISDYKNNPPSKHSEKIQRNPAGNMTKWESFDDDGDTKTQARSFEASYKNDTLLLKSSSYLYFNWKQTVNKYDGKNQLKKSTFSVGNRNLNGKVTILDKTIIIYKNNLPFKSTEKKLNKKVKTISYVYEEGKEIQNIVTPTKSYQEVKVSTYLDTLSLLTKYTETQEGEPFVEINIEYDTSYRIKTHTEVEFRKNGKDWKTIKEYNPLGHITKKSFYISNELRREDTYQYIYFSPTPPPIEEEDE